MGKSIRSKIKRRFRAIKRENLDALEHKQIEERNVKLKLLLGQQELTAEAVPKPEVAAAMADGGDTNFEFGKPARVRNNKLKKVKKQRKKQGVPARLRAFM